MNPSITNHGTSDLSISPNLMLDPSTSSSASFNQSSVHQYRVHQIHSHPISHPSLSVAAFTPEGTPPKAFSNTVQPESSPILHPPLPCRAISPPTPAPSPQPNSDKDSSHWTRPLPQAHHLSIHPDDPLYLIEAFGALSLPNRVKFLNSLLPILNLNELTNLSGKILPRLKRDFLRELPIEVSLHILSFVDDPKTLMRAGMVSRFWRSLVSDEATWKGMCWRRGFNSRTPIIPPLSLTERMEKERKGRVATYRAGVEERRRRKKNSKQEAVTERTSNLPSGQRQEPVVQPDHIHTDLQRSSVASSLGIIAHIPTRALGLEGRVSDEFNHANPSHAYIGTQPQSNQLSTPYLSNPHASTSAFSRRNSFNDLTGSPRPAQPQHSNIHNHSSTSIGIGALPNTLRSHRPPPLSNIGGLGLQSTLEPSPIPADSTQIRIKQPHRVINANSPEPGMVAPTDATSPRRTRPQSMPLIGFNLNFARSQIMSQADDVSSIRSSAHSDRRDSLSNTPTTANLLEVPPSASTFDDAEHSPRSPFSYKSYFKRAYLTESNWLRGPGEQLSVQTSRNYDGNEWVVTSLSFDDDWILVGMATSMVHVFSAHTGEFVRTLAGHESGVWCLALVSKGGSRDVRDPIPQQHGKGKGPAVVPDVGSESSETIGPASDWIASDHHHIGNYHVGSGGGASMMRAKGGLGMVTWGYSPQRERRRSMQTTVTGPSLQPDAINFHLPSAAMAAGPAAPSYNTAPKPTTSRIHEGMSLPPLQASFLSSGQELGDAISVPMRPGSSMPPPIPISSDSSSISSFTSSGSTPYQGTRPGQLPSADETRRSRRRSSFSSFNSSQFHRTHVDDPHRPGSSYNHQSGGVSGGMGLGAGGPSAGNLQQSSACGISSGWGQKKSIAVSGGSDRSLRVWEVQSGRCLYVLPGHTSTIRCLKVLEGRPIAVSGSRDSTLRVWDIEQGLEKHVLHGHTHSVRAVEVHGNRAVSGSYDTTCRLWNVDTGECLQILRGHYHQIYAVAFDGKRIASGSMDSTVCIWAADTGELLALLQGHTALVGQVQLNGLSNVLVTGGSDGRVVIFCLETFECLHRLCAHDNSVTCLQFDDRFVVTGGNDGRVKLWDFQTGAFIRELAEPCDAVWSITLRDDKAILLCKREGRTIMEVISFRPRLD